MIVSSLATSFGKKKRVTYMCGSRACTQRGQIVVDDVHAVQYFIHVLHAYVFFLFSVVCVFKF